MKKHRFVYQIRLPYKRCMEDNSFLTMEEAVNESFYLIEMYKFVEVYKSILEPYIGWRHELKVKIWA